MAIIVATLASDLLVVPFLFWGGWQTLIAGCMLLDLSPCMLDLISSSFMIFLQSLFTHTQKREPES